MSAFSDLISDNDAAPIIDEGRAAYRDGVSYRETYERYGALDPRRACISFGWLAEEQKKNGNHEILQGLQTSYGN